MFKRTIIKIILILMLGLNLSGLAIAAAKTPLDTQINNLLYDTGGTYDEKQNTKIVQTVGNLPDVSIPSAIASIVKLILRSFMYITLFAIIMAGFYYITARGKEEKMEKAKTIIINLLIGTAIVAIAYGVVSGLSQFNFFQ